MAEETSASMDIDEPVMSQPPEEDGAAAEAPAEAPAAAASEGDSAPSGGEAGGAEADGEGAKAGGDEDAPPPEGEYEVEKVSPRTPAPHNIQRRYTTFEAPNAHGNAAGARQAHPEGRLAVQGAVEELRRGSRYVGAAGQPRQRGRPDKGLPRRQGGREGGQEECVQFLLLSRTPTKEWRASGQARSGRRRGPKSPKSPSRSWRVRAPPRPPVRRASDCALAHTTYVSVCTELTNIEKLSTAELKALVHLLPAVSVQTEDRKEMVTALQGIVDKYEYVPEKREPSLYNKYMSKTLPDYRKEHPEMDAKTAFKTVAAMVRRLLHPALSCPWALR